MTIDTNHLLQSEHFVQELRAAANVQLVTNSTAQ